MIGVEPVIAASDSANAPKSFCAFDVGAGRDELLHELEVAVVRGPHHRGRAVGPRAFTSGRSRSSASARGAVAGRVEAAASSNVFSAALTARVATSTAASPRERPFHG